MKRLGLHEIRKEFLDFFESKEHLILPSFSLVPKNDKSLLLIGAGMAPLKKFFTGEEVPPRTRVATCQKCIRTGDIENVGKTDRHATFFEMLGNFSFGDYFKKEAMEWAWEFLTCRCEIAKDDLWVTVYEEDEEAHDLWRDVIGVPEERIVRLGKEDNFWELEVGPSGPCSEIYVDRGQAHGCGSPDCKPGCECDRFIEVWNLVFTQFDKDEEGVYHPLANPNIDTGMGLERIATVLQQTNNIFEIDALQEVLKKIEEVTGYTYGTDGKKDESVRVITDHIRAITFMIGDSIIPSNEGRGYVLRRLIRRAARHGKLLGVQGEFLTIIARTVISSWSVEYKNLLTNQEMIEAVISREEKKFLETLDTGLSILEKYLDEVQGGVLSGSQAFKFYDTYGFPVDLTEEIAMERGIKTDLEGFQQEMEAQKERARNARDDSDNIGWSHTQGTGPIDAFTVKFVGYDRETAKGNLLGLFVDGEEREILGEGEKGVFVADVTPFYGQGGGQVGDRGEIRGKDFTIKVLDTQKTKKGIIYHLGEVVEGAAKKEPVVLEIDHDRRAAIRRNHSVTHLLHKALKEVIGPHVNQAGSEVLDTAMRFDFTHYEGVSKEDLEKVEEMVNREIYHALPVTAEEMSMEEANAKGAVGLFEDKYGEVVRVVSMGDFSTELCGGTHVGNTSEIGMFKILSEGGISAGVRRIESTTGLNVYKILKETEKQEEQLRETLKAPKGMEIEKVKALTEEVKNLHKELDELKKAQAREGMAGLYDEVKTAGRFRYITASLDGVDPENLRSLGEELRDKTAPSVVVLASVQGDGKIFFVSAVSKEYTKEKVSAGNILREIAKIAGGGGGGRPDFATAGGKNRDKLPEALAEVPKILENL